MTLPHRHEPTSVQELFANGIPCLIAALVGLGLLYLGVCDVLGARGPRSDDWHFWWGLLHCALGGFLWFAFAMRFGWLVPSVVIGILLGECFGDRRGISRVWIPETLDRTLFPLLVGAAAGYFVGILMDVLVLLKWLAKVDDERS